MEMIWKGSGGIPYPTASNEMGATVGGKGHVDLLVF